MEDFVVVMDKGFSGHITVGMGAKIAGQAGITKDVEPGAFLKGTLQCPFNWLTEFQFYKENYPNCLIGLLKMKATSRSRRCKIARP